MKYLKINILSIINLILLMLITILKIISGLIRGLAKVGMYIVGFCFVYWFCLFIMNFNIDSILSTVGDFFNLIGVVFLLGGFAMAIMVIYVMILVLSGISVVICTHLWDYISNFICNVLNIIINLLINLYVKNYNAIILDNNYKCVFGPKYKLERDLQGEYVARKRIEDNEKKSVFINCLFVNIVAGIETIIHKLLRKKEIFGIFMVCVFLIILVAYQNYITITCFDMLYIKYLSCFKLNDILATLLLVLYLSVCVFFISNDIALEMDDYKAFLDTLVKRERITL